MHTKVPGPDGEFGFGGKCFPKDLNSFTSYCLDIGIEPVMLKATWDRNLLARKNKDWLNTEAIATKEKDNE